MRVLYVAIDQTVPGTIGGSVHVTAVAEGLAALGHEVHVLAAPGPSPFPSDTGASWRALAPPGGARHLRLLTTRRVREVARELRPDVVVERYHNFGGEGLLAARAVGALAVLEVNAPVIDYPGSAKAWIDRALIVSPMRRWREWQCSAADLIVTPYRGMLPRGVSSDQVLEVEWGADTTRFQPDATGAPPYARSADELVVVFAGAFRAWHGAVHLVEAVRRLRSRGRSHVRAVFIGDGPELGRTRAAARDLDGVTFTGAVAYASMPAALAAADIGAAPFDVGAHGPLALGFYWSPLKVFEYMATALPVVAPDIDRLRAIARPGLEGVLYDASDSNGLANAIEALSDPSTRTRLGTSARERVVERFGWDTHCQTLAAAFERALRQRRGH